MEILLFYIIIGVICIYTDDILNKHLLIQKVAAIDEEYFNWFVSECLDGIEALYGAKILKEK
ncbi:MAG: hypothetical protein ABS949_07760 [Solibacillus sp.]